LQSYLQHDEAYCKNEPNNFIAWVTIMIDHQRNQQVFLSNKRIKQIKACWEAQVKMLQDAIATCKKINEMRGDVILKAFVIVKQLQGR